MQNHERLRTSSPTLMICVREVSVNVGVMESELHSGRGSLMREGSTPRPSRGTGSTGNETLPLVVLLFRLLFVLIWLTLHLYYYYSSHCQAI